MTICFYTIEIIRTNIVYLMMKGDYMFGLELKYIIILALLVLVVIGLIKKLFKLAIIVGIIIVLYYLYTIFIG